MIERTGRLPGARAYIRPCEPPPGLNEPIPERMKPIYREQILLRKEKLRVQRAVRQPTKTRIFLLAASQGRKFISEKSRGAQVERNTSSEGQRRR